MEDRFRRKFDMGVAEAFAEAGADPSLVKSASEYHDLYVLAPEAFMEGFSEAVKEAQQRRPAESAPKEGWLQRQMDGMSWEKAKKWLLGAGLVAAGMGVGSMWGRHANAVGNPRGPVLGPILGFRDAVRNTALKGLSGMYGEYVDEANAAAAASGAQHG